MLQMMKESKLKNKKDNLMLLDTKTSSPCCKRDGLRKYQTFPKTKNVTHATFSCLNEILSAGLSL